MKCPYCGHDDSKVTDSREADDGIRRRRECLNPDCARRFTTYERVQIAALTVVKRDGRREDFSREKVLAGIHRSCAKLPISAAAIAAIAEDIESTLHANGVQEIGSSEIGDMVMERLRELDHIAYVRFASHYRKFLSLEELQAEFERLSATPLQPVRGGGAAQPPLLPATELSRIEQRAAGAGQRSLSDSPALQEPTPITGRSRRRAGGGR